MIKFDRQWFYSKSKLKTCCTLNETSAPSLVTSRIGSYLDLFGSVLSALHDFKISSETCLSQAYKHCPLVHLAAPGFSKQTFVTQWSVQFYGMLFLNYRFESPITMQ